MAPKMQKSESSDEQLLPVAEKVTYRPGPEGPLETVWMRHKFDAHVTRTVTDPKLIEAARNNPFFKVGEFDPAADKYKPPVIDPKTPESYRAYAIAWLKEIKSIDELCSRWAREQRLRDRLEVGADDFRYMSPMFQVKVDELIRREEDPKAKRDEIVRNNELADLELQIVGLGQAA